MTKALPAFDYNKWITEQAANVDAAARRFGMQGAFKASVHVIPSSGTTAGKLVVEIDGFDPPEGSVGALRFNGIGSNIMAVPYSQMRSYLWDACRHSPICPTA